MPAQKDLNIFGAIMMFYIFLSYIIFPLGFYFLLDSTLTSAGHGFVIGSLISVLLWLGYGSKMV
jgi:hypothetical protein|uniref:Uncharacterized protein n=1 Tax=viral metagenome TaxID=1070528 RepID=A0A6C0B2G7_9ZZZZ